MFRQISGAARSLLAPTCLAASLLLSACAANPVTAPASAPSGNAKPALAIPPASLMTPHGY